MRLDAWVRAIYCDCSRGKGCFTVIGCAENGRSLSRTSEGRLWGCFAVIGRAEKGRGLAVTSEFRWWGCFAVIGRVVVTSQTWAEPANPDAIYL